MQDLLPWMAPWGVWSLYLLMFIAGCALAWQGWFARRLHDHPRCPKCGYDRTGLPSATCPECGYCVTRPWEPYTSRRRRLSLVLLGLLVAAALPSAAVTRRVRVYGWEYYRRVGPVYWLFPTETAWVHRIGDYTITCLTSPGERDFSGELVRITQGGAVLYRRSDLLTHLAKGLEPGTDLNGNGVPDVAINFVCGGSGASQHYEIIELGSDGIRNLGEFWTKGEGEATATFEDVNKDGIFEIDAYDWIYDGNESHPVPSMLLWDGNQFTRRPYYTCARPGADW